MENQPAVLYSERLATQMFENEPGVLIHEVPKNRKRKSYRTIRIRGHAYDLNPA